jgi:hypothetical protein
LHTVLVPLEVAANELLIPFKAACLMLATYTAVSFEYPAWKFCNDRHALIAYGMPRFLRATVVLSLHGVVGRQAKHAEKLRITGLELGKRKLRNNFNRQYTSDGQ